MTSFWSLYVIVLTVGSLLAILWLLMVTRKGAAEELEKETTGHSFDGIEEYNNPLPRWWLWKFYLTLIFAAIYFILYPGLGNFGGVLGWSSTGEHDEAVEAHNAKFDALYTELAKTSIPELAKDAKALEIGQRLYMNNCSVCHGADAGGAIGFPNLTDNDWLYGDTPEAIKTTILKGRANGVMPGWLDSLGEKGVNEVSQFVMSLSGRTGLNEQMVKAGQGLYNTNCMACHGPEGKGNTALGAPNLTDTIWLFGGSPTVIKNTIRYGRNAIMPAHEDILGEDKAHVLAAYVYSLSHE